MSEQANACNRCDVASVLRELAKEMDAEYERLARVQHRDKLGFPRSQNGASAGELQIGGRLDALAWWACRTRTLADAHDMGRMAPP